MLVTWVEKKGWRRVKKKLPKSYVWKCQLGRRKNKKRKAMGDIIMGIRKDFSLTSEWRKTGR